MIFFSGRNFRILSRIWNHRSVLIENNDWEETRSNSFRLCIVGLVLTAFEIPLWHINRALLERCPKATLNKVNQVRTESNIDIIFKNWLIEGLRLYLDEANYFPVQWDQCTSMTHANTIRNRPTTTRIEFNVSCRKVWFLRLVNLWVNSGEMIRYHQ